MPVRFSAVPAPPPRTEEETLTFLWRRAACLRGCAAPSYVVLSYKYEQKDGRISYPLLFIYYSPDGGRSTRASAPPASPGTDEIGRATRGATWHPPRPRRPGR